MRESLAIRHFYNFWIEKKKEFMKTLQACLVMGTVLLLCPNTIIKVVGGWIICIGCILAFMQGATKGDSNE